MKLLKLKLKGLWRFSDPDDRRPGGLLRLEV